MFPFSLSFTLAAESGKCSPGDKRGSFIKERVKGQDDPSDQCGTILRLDEKGTDETAPSLFDCIV